MNAIAVFQKAGRFGHVAVVTATDGVTMTISESNWGSRRETTRTILASEASGFVYYPAPTVGPTLPRALDMPLEPLLAVAVP